MTTPDSLTFGLIVLGALGVAAIVIVTVVVRRVLRRRRGESLSSSPGERVP